MTVYYSKDRTINDLVNLLVNGGWQPIKGKHWKLYSPDRKKRVTVPMTPSDHRAVMNFKADIRRIERANRDPQRHIQ